MSQDIAGPELWPGSIDKKEQSGEGEEKLGVNSHALTVFGQEAEEILGFVDRHAGRSTSPARRAFFEDALFTLESSQNRMEKRRYAWNSYTLTHLFEFYSDTTHGDVMSVLNGIAGAGFIALDALPRNARGEVTIEAGEIEELLKSKSALTFDEVLRFASYFRLNDESEDGAVPHEEWDLRGDFEDEEFEDKSPNPDNGYDEDYGWRSEDLLRQPLSDDDELEQAPLSGPRIEEALGDVQVYFPSVNIALAIKEVREFGERTGSRSLQNVLDLMQAGPLQNPSYLAGLVERSGGYDPCVEDEQTPSPIPEEGSKTGERREAPPGEAEQSVRHHDAAQIKLDVDEITFGAGDLFALFLRAKRLTGRESALLEKPSEAVELALRDQKQPEEPLHPLHRAGIEPVLIERVEGDPGKIAYFIERNRKLFLAGARAEDASPQDLERAKRYGELRDMLLGKGDEPDLELLSSYIDTITPVPPPQERVDRLSQALLREERRAVLLKEAYERILTGAATGKGPTLPGLRGKTVKMIDEGGVLNDPLFEIAGEGMLDGASEIARTLIQSALNGKAPGLLTEADKGKFFSLERAVIHHRFSLKISKDGSVEIDGAPVKGERIFAAINPFRCGAGSFRYILDLTGFDRGGRAVREKILMLGDGGEGPFTGGTPERYPVGVIGQKEMERLAPFLTPEVEEGALLFSIVEGKGHDPYFRLIGRIEEL